MNAHSRLLAALLLAGASSSFIACSDDDGSGDSKKDSGTDAGPDEEDGGGGAMGGGGDGGAMGGGGDGGATGGGDQDSGPLPEKCPEHPNVSEEGDYCMITGPQGGEIKADLTLEPIKDKTFVISNAVFVGEDVGGKATPTAGKKRVTLTIKPGTKIVGADQLSFLLINRGSKLLAEGTKENPIVFGPSGEEAPQPGQWGGVIINGRAPTNKQDGDGNVMGEAGTGVYGGPDEDDDSGVVKYVRIEFGGGKVDEMNELNGLTLQGVGRGTTLDYIQVHGNDDDGIEFFGGTVDAKHIIITSPADDGIDWTDGWTGRLQFAIVQQWPHTNPGSGGNDAANGIEADSNQTAPTAEPISSPVFSNVTLVGDTTITGGTGKSWGLLLRRGTQGQFHNFVVLNYKDACLSVRSDQSAGYAGDELVLKNSRMFCDVSYDPTGQGEASFPAAEEAMFEGADLGNELLADKDAALEDAYGHPGDFKPKADLLTGGEVPSDSFFEDASFIGALGEDDWTAGEWYKTTDY